MRDGEFNLKRQSESENDKLFDSYVDMKQIVDFFWEARWVMLVAIIASVVVSQVYLLVATKKYSSIVTIAEKGAQGNISSIGGDSSVLAKLVSAKGDSSGSALSLTYAVKSTAVAERVVKSMNLHDEWLRKRIGDKSYQSMRPEERFTTAVSMVRSEIKASSDKENPGLIKVSLTDVDKVDSYDLLKQFLIELQYVMSATDLIFNKRLRLFYEDRLKVIDNKLLVFGSEISKVYGMNKLSYDKSTFSYDNIPMDNYSPGDFEFGVSSLDFLSQIYENVRTQVKDVQRPDKLAETIEVPQQVYLTFLEDKYNMLRSLRQMVTQQYEYALVEEKRNEQRFIVIEAPLVPKYPSVPATFFVTLVGFLLGLLISFVSAILYYYIVTRRSTTSCSIENFQLAPDSAFINETE